MAPMGWLRRGGEGVRTPEAHSSESNVVLGRAGGGLRADRLTG
jgi:hypothetical protein